MSARHSGSRRAVAVLACAVAALLPAGTAGAQANAPRTERISVAAGGAQGDGSSSGVALSGNGRYAAFASAATNLVPGDTNAQWDVFVRDLRTGAVERISVATGGAQGDGPSFSPSLSADGRYVAFGSRAANLVPDDTNAEEDVFVHDRRTGRTTGVTIDGLPHTGEQGSQMPVISADGSHVAFASSRADLVPGDTNGSQDIFVRQLRDGSVKRVSVTATGGQATGPSASPVLSADGRKAGFISKATNLPGSQGSASGRDLRPRSYPFYVHDLDTGRTEVASQGHNGEAVGAWEASLSPDGRYAVFSSSWAEVVPGHPAGRYDLFARDLVKGTTQQLTFAHDGSQISQGESMGGTLTADNRCLFFTSSSPNLVPNDTNNATDAFVRDMRTGAVTRISTAEDGTQGDDFTGTVAADAFGRTAVFESDAANLVPGDTNGVQDVFVRSGLRPVPGRTPTG